MSFQPPTNDAAALLQGVTYVHQKVLLRKVVLVDPHLQSLSAQLLGKRHCVLSVVLEGWGRAP